MWSKYCAKAQSSLTEDTSLKALRDKLKAQRKHLDELDQHIQELEKGAGGEQH